MTLEKLTELKTNNGKRVNSEAKQHAINLVETKTATRKEIAGALGVSVGAINQWMSSKKSAKKSPVKAEQMSNVKTTRLQKTKTATAMPSRENERIQVELNVKGVNIKINNADTTQVQSIVKGLTE